MKAGSRGEPVPKSRVRKSPVSKGLAFSGKAICVRVRRSLGPHLAATNIRQRTILLDQEVLGGNGDFERILIHELFHFVWVRLSNQQRQEWGGILARELADGCPGELGWSSEWRKRKLTLRDWSQRTPKWRRYICESFCDTAAWLYAGLRRHEEFTLEPAARKVRRAWLRQAGKPLSI